MKHRSKIAALSTALLGVIVFVPASLAADPTNVTVAAGSLSVTSPLAADFAVVTLDGTAKTRTAALDSFSATDARGSGAGWNITVQASQFKEWNTATSAYVGTGAKLLSQGSLSMPAPSVTLTDGNTAPVISGTPPWLIDNGSAVKIASAAVNTGMGSYSFGGVTLTLSIPASAYAAQYRSDVTISAVSGP